MRARLIKSLRLPPVPGSVAQARRRVDDVAHLLPKDELDDVRLMVSELVTNSIRHGDLRPEDTIELRFEAREDALRISVRDPGAGFSPDPADRDGEHGWGLFLVGRLADRWGVSRGARDTTVWFEVGIEEPRIEAR